MQRCFCEAPTTPGVAVTGGCAVLCTQARTFNGALGVCDRDTGNPGWHIAILNTPARRTEFGQKLPMAAAWIGLQKDTGIWRWLNPSNEVQSSTGAPWASGEPMFNNDHGVFDSTNQSNVFRTGTVTATEQFFCEYRP